MTRLHWFWRAVIVLIVSATLGFLCSIGVMYVAAPYAPGVHIQHLVFGGLAFSAVSSAAAAIAISSCVNRGRQDRETRCRKCGYILRGIPEPRCSECGERI